MADSDSRPRSPLRAFLRFFPVASLTAFAFKVSRPRSCSLARSLTLALAHALTLALSHALTLLLP
eukprot:2773289-Pleurochrysis_carterae.AAC.1